MGVPARMRELGGSYKNPLSKSNKHCENSVVLQANLLKASASLSKCLLSASNMINSAIGPILHVKHSSLLLNPWAARTQN